MQLTNHDILMNAYLDLHEAFRIYLDEQGMCFTWNDGGLVVIWKVKDRDAT